MAKALSATVASAFYVVTDVPLKKMYQGKLRQLNDIRLYAVQFDKVGDANVISLVVAAEDGLEAVKTANDLINLAGLSNLEAA